MFGSCTDSVMPVDPNVTREQNASTFLVQIVWSRFWQAATVAYQLC